MANQPQRMTPFRADERGEGGATDVSQSDMSQRDPYAPEAWPDDSQATYSAASQPEGTATAAKSLSDTAVETARVVAGTVAGQAKSLAANVAQELGNSAELGVGKGADAIDGVAKAIRTAADELDRTSPTIARSVRSAAGQLETFTDNIRGKSVGDLMNAAKDLARSQPTYFIAGAVIAGIAISRFIKSGKPSAEPSSNPIPPEGSGFGEARRWE